MSDAHPSNPLQRAHALSAQAHELLVPINPSLASLNTALRYFQEATDLFDAASNSSVGEGDQGKTLRMLVVQHRKLAKDVERRINALTRAGPSSHSMGASPPSVGRFSAVGGYRGLGSPEAGPSRPGLAQRRVVSEAGSAHMRSGEVTLGPGVGMGGPSMQNPGGIASRLSPPMGIPPFALRPPSTFPPMASTSASPTIPLPAAAASGSTNTTSARATQPSLSPLYSSSSSSSAPEESYIHFGPPPDASKMDPFSRFWGMLENMLEEVSNPVVFASAPMGPGPGQAQAPGSDRKRTQKDNERDKLRDRNGGEASTKPEESFYMVRKGKQREPSEDEEEDIGEGGGRATTPNAPKKTSEELLMENESLKTSLDALSLHAQSVERNNQLLKAQLADRDKGFRTAVENIKREANRGKEVWRSQLLASSPTTSTSLAKPTPSRNPLPTVPDAAVASGGNGGVAGGSNAGAAGKMNSPVEKGGVARGHNEEVSRRRIQELEDQVRTLRLENEKQRSQIDKYKDRIDKIKVNARAKKEAKLAAEAEARAASPRS
ncbi:hypothetical protein I316_05246 [Kwoniella heveanensis BCC8398]|uniref:Uncharacterized protein n=1 Tax=Kwoniella heveanensis BCC8398 TaxID=1296120 RepID=A0A1B9GQC0_9TREE|nr:hypothetical protein I316_05246 [Kwoniella heveanensis BCC8398]